MTYKILPMKVFKLRKGAGSLNVRLVPIARVARVLAKQGLGEGFCPVAGYTAELARRYDSARCARSRVRFSNDAAFRGIVTAETDQTVENGSDGKQPSSICLEIGPD